MSLLQLRLRWARHRLLRQFRPLSEDSRDGDHVQVAGTARALGEPITAPLSAALCLASRTWLGPFSVRYETVFLQPFALETVRHGRVTVDAPYARFAVPRAELSDLDEMRRRAFFARHGVLGREQMPGALYEQTVCEGDAVIVGGLLMRGAAPRPPATELAFRSTEYTVELAGTRAFPIVIAAADRALR